MDITHLFEYKNGNLYNKIDINPRAKKGALSGSLCDGRYRTVVINKKRYYVHRLIWLMHYGYMPKEIDHINRNKLDNRIENLREVTRSENILNTKISVRNKSGIKGVSWSKSKQKWLVQKTLNKERKTLGYFDCLNKAKEAVIQYECAVKPPNKDATI